MEIVLSIAGSDPSAGAGIQQDLKTMTALGCYGATVITALTTQNTLGVQDAMPVPKQTVASQLKAVLEDFDVKCIKIGQIPNGEVARVIVDILQEKLQESGHRIPIVYDPVMVSTSGRRLMEADCMVYVQQHLLPLCFLITPNIPEAEQLLGHRLEDETAYRQAGAELAKQYATHVLLKGGHTKGNEVNDRLFLTNGSVMEYPGTKIETKNLHGTGCTLSSAIASHLAQGYSLEDAVRQAKDFVATAILHSRHLHIGHGNGPIWNF